MVAEGDGGGGRGGGRARRRGAPRGDWVASARRPRLCVIAAWRAAAAARRAAHWRPATAAAAGVRDLHPLHPFHSKNPKIGLVPQDRSYTVPYAQVGGRRVPFVTLSLRRVACGVTTGMPRLPGYCTPRETGPGRAVGCPCRRGPPSMAPHRGERPVEGGGAPRPVSVAPSPRGVARSCGGSYRRRALSAAAAAATFFRRCRCYRTYRTPAAAGGYCTYVQSSTAGGVAPPDPAAV